MSSPRLISGSSAALELRLAEEIAAARDPDPLTPVCVLIGGTLLRPYLQRQLAQHSGGIANVHLLTPADFSLALGERAMWKSERLPLPPLADRVLLRQLAADHNGYFAPVRDTPGLSDALHRLVRELRGAGYDAADLSAAIGGACEVAGKAAALSDLFSEFLEKRAGFYGPDDCLLEADTAAGPWSHIFTFGLWEAPAALRRVLDGLAQTKPVTVMLPATGSYADDAHAEFKAWVTDGDCEHIDLERPGPSSALSGVRSQLFHAAPSAVEADSTFRLISAPDPTREVREVARACLRWAKDGIRFHEMAIVYRNPDPYRSTIESVFAEAEIPVYLHEGTPLAERPLGRRALGLLDLLESKLERRKVIDFLADLSMPKATYERYDKPSVTRWDRISREAGVVRGLDQWRARLSARIEELEASNREWERADISRTKSLLTFVNDLSARFAQQPGTVAWSEHLTYMRRLFDAYISDADAIFDAIDGLSRFDALGEVVSAQRFRDTVRGAIENLRSDDVLNRRQGAFGLRGVNVLDANSVRQLGFRAVAIVGLIERSFPPPPHPDPLLLDPERVKLNEVGPAAIPLRVMGPDPEPLQFAVAVDAARERLLASYSRKGAGSGRAQLPSSLFRALAEAAVGRRVGAQDVDSLPGSIYTHVRGARIGAEQVPDALSDTEYQRTLLQADPAVGRGLLIDNEPRIGAALAAREARNGRRLTAYDGVLTEAGAQELTKLELLERSWGPSGLHTYAGCPQKFFLGSVMRARKSEEPEELIQISAADRGSLIHLVLERFLAESPAPGEDRLYGAGEQTRLISIAEEEFAAAEERGETGYPLLWSYDRANIREDLNRWLESERRDPEFRVLTEGDYEVRFAPWAGGGSEGDLSTEKPIEIELDGATLKVGGKIDRLNWDPERRRFRVIDYKTGRNYKDESSKLLGGEALQLPLYIHAGARALGMPAESGTAEYHYATRAGQYSVQRFTAEDLREREDDLKAVLSRIASGISRGEFQMAPREARVCEWCDFNRICPSARMWQIDRKRQDPVAVSFQVMRDVK